MPPPPVRGRCWFRVHTLLALALAAWATGAAAQSGAAFRLEEGRFFLEKITVEGVTGFSPEIILAESLLETGRVYAESELRDAAHRIRRLPLVLDVEFSLKKGSERDRYELVIRVRETRRWFWGLDLELAGWSEPVSVSGIETTSFTESDLFLIGRRFAAGRYGVAYAALGGSDGTIQVGYSHHNLFGRGGFGSLSLAGADCASDDRGPADPSDVGKEGCQTELIGLGLDPTYSNWSVTTNTVRLRLTLGYPLGGNQSLRLKGSYRATESGFRRLALDTDPDRLALFFDRYDVALNLSWVSNSIDDPVFPTRGTLLEAGLDVQSLEADLVQYDLGGAPSALATASRSHQLAALATAAWHRPVGERGAFSLGGEALLGRSRIRGLPGYDLEPLDADVTVWSASATAGFGLFLKQLHTAERWRELRWESSAQVSAAGVAPSLGQDQAPHFGGRVTTGLTYRNTWGVLRLTLSWIGLEATP